MKKRDCEKRLALLTLVVSSSLCSHREEPFCWYDGAECTVRNDDTSRQIECILTREFPL